MNGVYSSMVVFSFVTYAFNCQSFRKAGQVAGMEVMGATMYTSIVWVVNCQIALSLSYFTWIQHFFIWGSILLWYIFLLVYGELDATLSTTAYRVLVETLGPAPMYWLIGLLVPVACILPYAAYESFHRVFYPMDHHLVQEIRYLRKHINEPEGYTNERAKAVQKTSIGFTAHVNARMTLESRTQALTSNSIYTTSTTSGNINDNIIPKNLVSNLKKSEVSSARAGRKMHSPLSTPKK